MHIFKIKNKLFQIIHMVKTIIKSYASRVCGTKRVRGLKSRIKSNNSTKKVKNNSRKIQAKPFDMNYYSQPKINFLLSQEDNTITRLLKKESLEFSEIKPDVTPKYKQEHRAVALIGLKDIIYQVYELCKGNVSLSDNFVFSVIALYELYIRNSEKDLSKSENIKSLFSCLIFIDQFQNIQVFTTSFFKKTTNPNFEMDLNILNVVDLNLFPVKIYDYFEIFYLRISQQKKADKKYQKYIKLFKDVFAEFNFYFTFHENSKIKKPSINFISCLIMTNTFIINKYKQKYDIMENCINYYKKVMNYDEQEYLFAKEIIKESKHVYDYLVSNLKVNKKCKEGLINNNTINCI